MRNLQRNYDEERNQWEELKQEKLGKRLKFAWLENMERSLRNLRKRARN